MMKAKLYFLICLLFLFSSAIFSKEEPLKVGDNAPEFILQDVEEEPHNLKKLRGKLVFLILGNRKIRKEDDKWADAFNTPRQIPML